MFEKLSKKWYTCNPYDPSPNQLSTNTSASIAFNEEKSDANAAIDKIEYRKHLTEFYQKHNLQKVAEVSKTLETYKVRTK